MEHIKRKKLIKYMRPMEKDIFMLEAFLKTLNLNPDDFEMTYTLVTGDMKCVKVIFEERRNTNETTK
jgi:hypothetical protein